jgi:uncharacterized caspase-like protein
MARVLHGALLAFAVCCVLTAPSAQERTARLALFIGNANYPDAGKPLTTPVNDAKALADAFRRLDFDATVKENLGKQDMRGAIDAFVSSVRPGSVALIYFAGYGLRAANQTYLMPVDANIWQEADIQREAISLETIVSQLHERGARTKIAVIDAAYRNPFERRFRNVPAGLATFGGPTGTLVLYSAAPGARAPDANGNSSIFADELVKSLRTADRAPETIFNETRLGVYRGSSGEQIPWVASSLVEDFRFARVAQEPQQVAPGAASPAPATPAPAPASSPPPAAAAKASPAPATATKAAPPAPAPAPAVAAPAPAVTSPTVAAPAPATPLPPGPGAIQPAASSPAPTVATPAPTTPLPPGPGAVQPAASPSEPTPLLGVFAWDCGRPPSDRNWYTMRRVIKGNRVEQAILARPGRPAVTVFDQASETANNTIAVSGTRGKKAVSSSWAVDGQRMRETEATADGQPEIAGGKWVRDGREVAWSRKCSP